MFEPLRNFVSNFADAAKSRVPPPGAHYDEAANACVTKTRDTVELSNGSVDVFGNVSWEVGTTKLAREHGTSAEVSLLKARVGSKNDLLRCELEFLTAKADVGMKNKDGSHGQHVEVRATVASGECTAGNSDLQVTAGIGAGVGIPEISAGLRDADNDGLDELCARGDIGFLKLGACIEQPEMETSTADVDGDGTDNLCLGGKFLGREFPAHCLYIPWF